MVGADSRARACFVHLRLYVLICIRIHTYACIHSDLRFRDTHVIVCTHAYCVLFCMYTHTRAHTQAQGQDEEAADAGSGAHSRLTIDYGRCRCTCMHMYTCIYHHVRAQ